MYTETQVSNALVSHKNKLINMIDNATTAKQLAVAKSALHAVKDCWIQLDYGYKWSELYERITMKFSNL